MLFNGFMQKEWSVHNSQRKTQTVLALKLTLLALHNVAKKQEMVCTLFQK